MSDGESSMNVAAELAVLRGEVRLGLSRIEGQLNLLVQSQAQTGKDIDDLDKRVTQLEARRWPLGPIAAVSGVVSAVIAALAIVVHV
jgi:hypothetical protein